MNIGDFKRYGISLTAVFLLSSCGIANHRHTAKLQDDANEIQEMKDSALRKSESMIIAKSCDQKRVLSRTIPGTLFEASECGLLYDSLVKDRQLEKEICPALKLKGKACVKKAGETFTARVGARYRLANFAVVQEVCKTDPVLCDSLRDMEEIILNSHNYAIDEQYKSAVAKIDEYHEKLVELRHQELEAEQERSRRAFAAFADGFSRGMNQSNQQSYQNTNDTAIKRTDWTCMQRCQNSGSMYSFCKSKCEY